MAARRLLLTPAGNSNEQEIVSVSAATSQDVDKAVQAAREALQHPSWRDLPGTERGRLLGRLAQLMDQHRETLATIETWDNGKPYTVSLNDDLTEAVETLRYYAGFADKVFGQVIETTPDKFVYTVREPVGVCGQIIPSVSFSVSPPPFHPISDLRGGIRLNISS